jgi:hypothetical protein
MKKALSLLPTGFKPVGFLLLFFGAVLGMVRFRYGIKPSLLDMKPFALYSSYIESKYLQFIGNNMSEEVVGLLLLVGLFFIAFSRDRIESELKAVWRHRALYLSFLIQMVYWVLAFLLTYGFAFVYALMGGIYVSLLAFILLFWGFQLANFLRNRSKSHQE